MSDASDGLCMDSLHDDLSMKASNLTLLLINHVPLQPCMKKCGVCGGAKTSLQLRMLCREGAANGDSSPGRI